MEAPLRYDAEINADDLYGTHYSVAAGFSDTGETGRTVEDTIQEIMKNPNILLTQNFVLTVFIAPDGGGTTRYWSANNRRLKAIKDAKARLGNPKDFPNIKFRWASTNEKAVATQPGKWGNKESASKEIGYHNTGSNTLRFQQTLSRDPDAEKQRTEYVEKTEQLLNENAKQRGPGKPGFTPLKGGIQKPHTQRDKRGARLNEEQKQKIAKEALTTEQYKQLYNF